MADAPFPSELAKELLAWLQRLTEVDDRLMIILAAARFDDLLRDVLQQSMRHEGGSTDSLFDPDRPIGSFSARIALAYRIGLIDRDFESFLQTLRKLRNDAAHAPDHIDLTSSPHFDRVNHLQTIARKSALWDTVRPADGEYDSEVTSHPRPVLLQSLIQAFLNFQAVQAEPVTVKEVRSFSTVRMMGDDGGASP